ncbi:MAG: type II secretion system protein J [Ignavibacteria bacterium]
MRRPRGFTLLELTVVIAITAVMAAALTVFLKPAIDAYFAARRRAELTDMADTALRRIGQDVRRAVPNSIIPSGGSCFELVPTVTGGRYRKGSDTASGGHALDTGSATSDFDVLSPTSMSAATRAPIAGDWIVVDNQNGTDVYSGGNRAQVGSVSTPVAAAGLSRITLSSAKQFPTGYDGGRFVAVADTEQVVVYSCVGGTLYRTVTTFGATLATACGLTTGAVVATGVTGCTFSYDPNIGSTQQYGLLWMRLQLTDATSGDSVVLAHGVHVDNSP